MKPNKYQEYLGKCKICKGKIYIVTGDIVVGHMPHCRNIRRRKLD